MYFDAFGGDEFMTAPSAPGDLVRKVKLGYVQWEIYRQDAGLGEKDYCVMRRGSFFCRTEDFHIADLIVQSVGEELIPCWEVDV